MNEENNTEVVNTTPETPTPEPVAPTPAPMAAAPVQQSSLVKDLSIPIAIVIAGAFIGAGFFFSQPASNQVADTNPTAQPAQQAGDTNSVNPVTEADHIKGSVDAPIKIVEYSDFECPFCKQFHETLAVVLDEYGDDQVAWVFRQFPLEQLHPVKAMAAAMGSECVAELGGSDAFWSYTDGYFEQTLTNNRTNVEVLIPQLVIDAGVNQAAFTECFETSRHTEAINEDVENAIATGGRGTPWSVVIGPDGSTYPVNGALPAAAIRQLIDQLLEA